MSQGFPIILALAGLLFVSPPSPAAEPETELVIDLSSSTELMQYPEEPLKTPDWIRVPPPLPPESPESPPLSAEEERVLADIASQTARVLSGFSGRKDSSLYDFMHAQVTRWLLHPERGPAFVVVVSKMSAETHEGQFLREGGGVGIQIPLGGSHEAALSDGDSQFVLRILPIAGNYERLAVLGREASTIHTLESDLVIRPMVELSAEFQSPRYLPRISGGARWLAQPRLSHPSEFRMMAEVYLKIRSTPNSKRFPHLEVVPRCVVDINRDNLDRWPAKSRTAKIMSKIQGVNAMCALLLSLNFGGSGETTY